MLLTTKKGHMKTKILFIGLALTAFIVAGNAQTTTDNTTTKKAKTSFVDSNNDGVCDNYVAKAGNSQGNGQGKAYRNGNGNRHGNGQCLKQGNGNGNGNKYGVRQGNRNGKGNGMRNGQGNGQSQFIDADNNGVCDNKE